MFNDNNKKKKKKKHAVVEVAASYQVCSGGHETRRGFRRIDEDGFDLGDLTSDNGGDSGD